MKVTIASRSRQLIPSVIVKPIGSLPIIITPPRIMPVVATPGNSATDMQQINAAISNAIAQHIQQLNPHPQYGTTNSYQSAEVDANCLVGQPLYMTANGHLNLAVASSIFTSRVVGLVVADTLSTHAVPYSPDTVIERSDWADIAGSAALIPGAAYFLDPVTPGKLTVIAPTETGQVVCPIGTALTPTKLDIEIQPFILL